MPYKSIGKCYFDDNRTLWINPIYKYLNSSYSIHFRLETTKLLLAAGADPFSKSKNSDDALQIACLKGAHDIFQFLIERIPYSATRLANANELIG